MPKGRKPIELNRDEFQAELTKLESTNKFETRSSLWVGLCETEWAKTRSPRPLTPQVAMLKADEFQLTIQTQKGRRGSGLTPGVRTPRTKKGLSITHLEVLTKTTPEQYRPFLNQAANGKKMFKNLLRLHCLECSGWSKGAVANCNVTRCSFHSVRPYQGKQEKVEGRTELSMVPTEITNAH